MTRILPFDEDVHRCARGRVADAGPRKWPSGSCGQACAGSCSTSSTDPLQHPVQYGAKNWLVIEDEGPTRVAPLAPGRSINHRRTPCPERQASAQPSAPVRSGHTNPSCCPPAPALHPHEPGEMTSDEDDVLRVVTMTAPSALGSVELRSSRFVASAWRRSTTIVESPIPRPL